MNKKDPIILVEDQNGEIRLLKNIISTLERRVRLLEVRLRSVDANVQRNTAELNTVSAIVKRRS